MSDDMLVFVIGGVVAVIAFFAWLDGASKGKW